MKNILIIVAFFISYVNAGDSQYSCKSTASVKSPGSVDIYCKCMEKFVLMDRPVYRLVINQSDCEKRSLTINWVTLQEYLGVKELVIDHANVVYDTLTARAFTVPTLTEVTFVNSKFDAMDWDAFDGLYTVKTIRIVKTKIEKIKADAFGGFQNLATVEFVDSKIGQVEANAFTNLINITDIAFVGCDIGTLKSHAINVKIADKGNPKPCSGPFIRSRSSADTFIDGFMGRSLSSVDDIDLPERGSKLLFLSTKIARFEEETINSTGFSYLIFGDNEIGVMESRALTVVLSNPCDFSGLLLVGNNFTTVKSGAFSKVTGVSNVSLPTLIVFVKNRFESVASEGFLINDDLNLPYISGNKFQCTCDSFDWFLNDENSGLQRKLEMKMLNSSYCTNQSTPVLKYANDSCPRFLNIIPIMEKQPTTIISSNPTLVTVEYSFISSTKLPPMKQVDHQTTSKASKNIVSKFAIHYILLILFIKNLY